MRLARPALAVLTAVVAPAVAAASGPAAARYERCPPVPGVSLVATDGASCGDARGLAAAVTAAPVSETADVLAGLGWTGLRARTVPRRSPAVHDLVALRGRAVVRLRRTGRAPDIDAWTAGRELVFASRRLVGGRPVPRRAATCTSAFLVRLSGGRRAGLSAAHCAGLRPDRRVARRFAALRRPPAPGIALGRVQRIATRAAPVDALVLPVPRGRGRAAAPVVDRGVSRPPWLVVGTARALPGRRVCFTGRTSGIDRCGRLRGPGLRGAERYLSLRAGLVVRCTTISARAGDSGGPVFTAPSAGGTVRAVGIVTLVVGRRSRMCFTPIGPALARLRAALITSKT